MLIDALDAEEGGAAQMTVYEAAAKLTGLKSLLLTWGGKRALPAHLPWGKRGIS